MALPPEKVKLIQSLLKEGKVSKREISRQTEVSRVTIDKIEKKLLFPEEIKPEIKILHFTESDNHLSEENRPEFVRCKGCGGLQQKGITCMVCQMRKRQMKEYDCYMEDLLKPAIVSPLSESYKAKLKAQEKKNAKRRTRKLSGAQPHAKGK